MTSPDPISILQRLSALSGAGRAVPHDLAVDALRWMSEAAPRILTGTAPAEALGLQPQPGSRSLSRQARQAERDRFIVDLFATATGSGNRRADTVLEWLACAATGDPIPAAAVPAARAAIATNLPLPSDPRTVQRAVARASRAGAVIGGTD